ncbi:hypothetical protein CC1G_13755 [Coprinopsis cinerea okayama7|uniref:Uncharacterized protein n=1 Tax=Coprinopsis cinerea (strain Okayama-7 / 130 / ATCC MYA-4618 / FGSC 9003) TaxID=240176 RepID=D6RK83_COPC7|nr:hypothetical protein CC1G_13755 [Coprinopsis cinerea okayama7\|eukprot:XP_002912223.1 hypothetical protein CC1G_13755 [Coprinopsis cinerea okayama7\
MSFMIIIPRASLPAFRTAVRTAPKPGVFATIKRDIHTRPNVTSLPSLVNAARRKFATATDYSLAEAIMSDQDDILVYADEFRRHVGNDDKQARWGNQLTWAIARYNVGEEIVLYPLLEEFLGGQGKKFADMDRKDSIVGTIDPFHAEELRTNLGRN